MQEDRGNIISFNVLFSTGEVVLPSFVQRLAATNQITAAVGSFNNPGIANLLGPAKLRVKNVSVFEKVPDFQCVQVSLGSMTNFEDAYRVVHFISKFRNQDYVSMEETDQFSKESDPSFGRELIRVCRSLSRSLILNLCSINNIFFQERRRVDDFQRRHCNNHLQGTIGVYINIFRSVYQCSQ